MGYNYIQFPAQRGIFPGNFWLAFKNYILGIKTPSNFILMNFKTVWHTKGKLSAAWHSLSGGTEENMWLQSNGAAPNLSLAAGKGICSFSKNVA